jgi:hypothetical protein
VNAPQEREHRPMACTVLARADAPVRAVGGGTRAALVVEGPMRVLLVEDHAELAETVAAGLRREGMAVGVAGDGRDALARVGLVRTTFDG